MGVTGCMRRESLADQMVNYMNEKYEDRFTYSAPFGGGTGGSARQILVTSEKYPDAEIVVTYSSEAESYSDNYVEHKYEQQTYELLEEVLSGAVQTEVLLTYEVGYHGTTDNFSEETTFEEYVSDFDALIQFIAVIKEDCELNDRDEFVQILQNKFSEHQLLAQGRLYFAEESSQFLKFGQLDLDVRRKLLQLNICMTSAGIFDTAEWRETR